MFTKTNLTNGAIVRFQVASGIAVIPDTPSVNAKLISFVGKGSGAFSKPAEVDSFLRNERDQWE